jgi:hypothetical protein
MANLITVVKRGTLAAHPANGVARNGSDSDRKRLQISFYIVDSVLIKLPSRIREGFGVNL